MSTNQVTLGYWDIRGLGEPIRAFLEYLEIPYKKETFTTPEAWAEKKANFGSLFPNLPYLVDGDKTLTESEAILTYLSIKAGKFELSGKEEDRVEFIQLKGIIMDVIRAFTRPVYYSKNNEEMKKGIDSAVNNMKYKLAGLEEILGKKEWIMGYLTYLDFLHVEFFERYIVLDEEIGTEITKDYPNLVAHVKRFAEIPKIKEYRSSERFRARPYNLSKALWR